MNEANTVTLTVIQDDQQTIVQVLQGANLRQTLLEHGISPYAPLTRRLNCGGRGICATCGVWIEDGEPAPGHWHDQLAARFGYPRLSCQVTVDRDMTVRILTEKFIWGQRDPARRYTTPATDS